MKGWWYCRYFLYIKRLSKNHISTPFPKRHQIQKPFLLLCSQSGHLFLPYDSSYAFYFLHVSSPFLSSLPRSPVPNPTLLLFFPSSSIFLSLALSYYISKCNFLIISSLCPHYPCWSTLNSSFSRNGPFLKFLTSHLYFLQFILFLLPPFSLSLLFQRNVVQSRAGFKFQGPDSWLDKEFNKTAGRSQAHW